MQLLSLDLATSCGWALGSTTRTNPLRSGAWELCKRNSSDAQRDRLVGLFARLEACPQPIDMVCYESPVQGRLRRGGNVLVELVGVTRLWCGKQNIPCHSRTPSQIKLFATGHGFADKDAMVRAAVKRWRKRFATHDEVDARWLWCLVRQDLKRDSANDTPTTQRSTNRLARKRGR